MGSQQLELHGVGDASLHHAPSLLAAETLSATCQAVVCLLAAQYNAKLCHKEQQPIVPYKRPFPLPQMHHKQLQMCDMLPALQQSSLPQFRATALSTDGSSMVQDCFTQSPHPEYAYHVPDMRLLPTLGCTKWLVAVQY